MSDNSKIEWTEATWNPVTGCTKVSPGCDRCYAERVTERFHGKGSFAEVKTHPERLDQPIRWKRPRRIFVNSMSDLFHDDVPDDFLADVFGVMAMAGRHTFQVLTKRHARMRALLSDPAFLDAVMDRVLRDDRAARSRCAATRWPLPNVWLGVSVEDQHWADIRIPALLRTPAAVRFLSCEPLLGPVDLRLAERRVPVLLKDDPSRRDLLHWVIVGGESGPGARPMRPEWAQSIRDQCAAAGVPFLFKQWGEWTPLADGDLVRVGKKAAGRRLDGRLHDEYPGAVA